MSRVLKVDLINAVESVTSGVAYQYTKWLASREGLMVGVSTGANVAVAQRYADLYSCDVLTVCFDSGERYLSVHGLFDGNTFSGKQS